MAVSALAAAAAQKVQVLMNGEHHQFLSSSDDHVVMKQILATHSPDGGVVDETPLLDLIKDILQRATPMTPQTHEEPVVEDTAHPAVVGMPKALANTIHRISCQMTCECTSGGDVEATTLALFNVLSSYTWGAKVVLVLAAFAVNYGEFWLTAHTANPLAKSVSLLKQLPDIIEHPDIHKQRFDAINNLINAMLEIRKCIVELEKVPSDYFSDSPHLLVAIQDMVPTSAYWTIRSVVACAAQITMLIGRGNGYISSPIDLRELSSLAEMVEKIHGRLTGPLKQCRQHITYQRLVRLFQTEHNDSTKILRALICSKDDLLLFHGTTKESVKVDVLKKKTVMFLISNLDISQEELGVLVKIYNQGTQEGKLERHYEIVWLPVIDSTKEETYDRLASMMPWYLLHDPLQVDAAVIKYIRVVWRFKKKPILVVLDPQGKVVCPNALHMMWIWGTQAVPLTDPFTINREEALWKQETWRLEFLVHEIDSAIPTWVKEGRFVCLYGGDDIDWIRRFTTDLRRVAQEAKITLEMVYVGKSNPNERVRKVVEIIEKEKLSGYWQDPVMMWFFWVRLESMWHSLMQHGKTIENDQIMQEVMTLLSYDGGEEGWALISRGSVEMVKAQGKKLIDCLKEFNKWKATAEQEAGFIPAMTNALLPYHTQEHCIRFILPGDTGKITEKVVCTECKRPMEKFILYRCCN